MKKLFLITMSILMLTFFAVSFNSSQNNAKKLVNFQHYDQIEAQHHFITNTIALDNIDFNICNYRQIKNQNQEIKSNNKTMIFYKSKTNNVAFLGGLISAGIGMLGGGGGTGILSGIGSMFGGGGKPHTLPTGMAQVLANLKGQHSSNPNNHITGSNTKFLGIGKSWFEKNWYYIVFPAAIVVGLIVWLIAKR